MFQNINFANLLQKMALDIVKENKAKGCDVNLAGDGKFDSPGKLTGHFSAFTFEFVRFHGSHLYVCCARPGNTSHYWPLCCT